MKAVICTKYGTPEVLQIQEVSKPIPKNSQILVKIVATAVNSGDVRVRSLDVKGFLKVIMRLVLGISKPRKPIIGTVFSGIVESKGNKVSKFKVGDKVFGMTGFYYCLINTLTSFFITSINPFEISKSCFCPCRSVN